MNPRSRKLIVSAVLVTLLFIALLGSALPALAAPRTVEGTLPPVTGLAADGQQQVWWASGAKDGKLHALDAQGKVTGEVGYGVTPESVQAVAVRRNKVWVGDVGDPGRTRKALNVYAVEAQAGGLPRVGETAKATRYELVHPDGARDAAAMTVSPNGRIYVITRGEGAGIFRTVPNPAPGGITNQLTRIGDAPAGVTDATYTSDGTKLVLRTSTTVHVYDGNSFQQVAAAQLPEGSQGQGLATALQGEGLVVASEGTSPVLTDLPVPTTLAEVTPAPESSTSSEASPSASASASTPPANVPQGPSRKGTWLALGLAALLSLAAAGFVALRK